MKRYIKPYAKFTEMDYEDVMIFSADPETEIDVGGIWGNQFKGGDE